MYEEPYRWIEAVGNRRQYLDDQFRQGSPIIALSYDQGILLLTVSRGTPKLYEIYDRIALGGMGHPADLEKLRFNLLDMAHLEGFNRSPSDVTGARLLKYGLAPTIKQAFEEIFKAPFITKILLAELGNTTERDQFLRIDYDGSFEELSRYAVLAGVSSIQKTLSDYVNERLGGNVPSLTVALDMGVKAWGMGSLLQQAITIGQSHDEEKSQDEEVSDPVHEFNDEKILAHVRQTLGQHTLECSLLDRTLSGPSTYRLLSPNEVADLLPSVNQAVQ